jgi:clan AA aspartic protease
MGETIVKIRVSNLTNKKTGEIEVLVDTGATYTTVPGEILEELGVEKVDKVVIELADGRTLERYIGNIYIEVEGRKRANPVIFGEESDASILGLVSLESCGLTVDPVNRKLVPLPKIHHYRNLIG